MLFFDFKTAAMAFVLRASLILFLIPIGLIWVSGLFWVMTRRRASLSFFPRPAWVLEFLRSCWDALESGLIDSDLEFLPTASA